MFPRIFKPYLWVRHPCIHLSQLTRGEYCHHENVREWLHDVRRYLLVFRSKTLLRWSKMWKTIVSGSLPSDLIIDVGNDCKWPTTIVSQVHPAAGDVKWWIWNRLESPGLSNRSLRNWSGNCMQNLAPPFTGYSWGREAPLTGEYTDRLPGGTTMENFEIACR